MQTKRTFIKERPNITKTVHRSGGKNHTVPDMAMNPSEALRKYATNALERNMRSFYDSQHPDFHVPDVSRLSHLERLQLQAKYADDVKTYRSEAIKEAERIRAMQAESKTKADTEPAPGESTSK